MARKIGYTLNRNGKIETNKSESSRRYYRRELLGMSTVQLRDIARREKVIQGIINPMDKDALIETIMRYRGADENLLIRKYSKAGWQALETALRRTNLQPHPSLHPECSAKFTIWQKLAVDFYDRLTVHYDPELVGTNALVLDCDGNLCGIFNVEPKGKAQDALYLRKEACLPCKEAAVKRYTLLFFDRAASAQIFRIYSGEAAYTPENIRTAQVPLVDFTVREPKTLHLPVAIDFGTSNTAAGAYLDHLYFESQQLETPPQIRENEINYAIFYDRLHDFAETNLLPSVVSVLSLKDQEEPQYLFGYDAVEMAADSYIDEGFCVFYDMKRWITDYEKNEEITDRHGRRAFVSRKEILRAFFLHVIHALENRLKCRIHDIHISSPVKQKYLFQKLFREILPEYAVEHDTIDEGVSVLYNTVSELIEQKKARKNQLYHALIIDCGGGTTDLSSCKFRVDDQRVSYKIDIETAYENGDTDFGGNNLTYRIMQLLKLKIAELLAQAYDQQQTDGNWALQHEVYGNKAAFDVKTRERVRQIQATKELLRAFDVDIFRSVDEKGPAALYQGIDKAYEMAEAIIPTKFKEWEKESRTDYFKVKNNFYFLFHCAEQVKKAFFEKAGALKIILTAEGNHEAPGRNWQLRREIPIDDGESIVLPMDKWKLAVHQDGGMVTIKQMRDIVFSIFDVNLLLTPDIYGVIQKFLSPLYESGDIEDYNIIKLTGQSCKIDLFRDSLKEFVPGRVIKSKRKSGDSSDCRELKMTCIDGALKYLRDKKYGYADVHIISQPPKLPYRLTGFTHNGEEVELIDGSRGISHGELSRNMDNLTLMLYLKDQEGNNRYNFTYTCTQDEFEPKTQEEIEAIYGSHIPQDDTDTIIHREAKFFIWSEPKEWGFMIVPVYREGETLMLGKEKFQSFENDGWMNSFFDGTK